RTCLPVLLVPLLLAVTPVCVLRYRMQRPQIARLPNGAYAPIEREGEQLVGDKVRILLRAPVLAMALAVLLVVLARPADAAAKPGQLSIYPSGASGYDVSWPNCGANLPTHPAFGIVGISDGLGYSQNPCLAHEAAAFPNLSLYVNTGWYDQSVHVNPNSPRVCTLGDHNCLAYNYGYNAGLYALDYAGSLQLSARTWWLDVETSNTWNADITQNRYSLQGEHDALLSNGVTTVGVYSTTFQWNSVTGSWLNSW